MGTECRMCGIRRIRVEEMSGDLGFLGFCRPWPKMQ